MESHPKPKQPRSKAPRISTIKAAEENKAVGGTKATMSRLYFQQSTKYSLQNVSTRFNPLKSFKAADSSALLQQVNKKVGVEDMIHLTELTEETLLKNLEARYNEDLIYTRVHSILVAINPFKQLPIYSAPVVKQYVGKPMNSLPPHIYGVTEAAYTSMRGESKNQSIIISGESGAGKSESCRLALQFLSGRMERRGHANKEGALVETMILETVPVLEALGNAKTVRNNNSSRFGKYIEIQFDKTGTICGARITQYLLEKSRVCSQATDERNYHIFYQMTEGSSQQEKEKYFLGPASSYEYLKRSGCYSIPGVDEAEEWSQFKQGLAVLKITDEQDHVFSLLAACLHLGNINITKTGDKAAIDDADPALAHASKLLNLTPNQLKNGLLQKKAAMGGAETVVMQLNLEQAVASRDALAKTIYSRLFDWVISKINALVHRADAQNFMGILDIFGFENFVSNSFEQFCINFANERLQHYFNHHIFKMEQEEYDREKIDWASITFKDNQQCLDLIEGRAPPGVLSLLDEECKFPKATDATFLQKVNTLNKNNHLSKIKPTEKIPKFGIKHYAGEVHYEVACFLDKNKDTVPDHFPALFKTNNNQVLQILFAEPPEDPAAKRTGKGKAVTTVGGNFKKQLGDLMQLLSSTNPFFVRCIKPNMAKTPNTWDSTHIAEQLAYSGMYETIRIRRLGYPYRFPFSDFFFRYKCLVPTANYVEAVTAELKKSRKDPKGIQFGLTKVFMRYDDYLDLENLRAEALKTHATKLQTWWRMIVLRRAFLKKKNVVLVQRAFRQWKTWLLINKLSEAIVARVEDDRRAEEARRRQEEENRTKEEVAALARQRAEEERRTEEALRLEQAEREEHEQARLRAEREKERLREEREKERVKPPQVCERAPVRVDKTKELEVEVARLQSQLASLKQKSKQKKKKATPKIKVDKYSKKKVKKQKKEEELDEFEHTVWSVMDGLSDEEIVMRVLSKDELIVEKALAL